MIKRALVFCGFFCAMVAYAQEAEGRENTYNIASYITSSPTAEELETMHKLVLRRVSTLQKKRKRSREENLTLLQDAQLLGNLYTTIRDEDTKVASATVLIAVRDEFISYIAKNKHDYEVKTELAFLVSMAFVAYIKDFYQSVRLMQEVAADVYYKAPNAKVALLLGQSNIAANSTGVPLLVNSLAEKYLRKAIELDKESSYISYLAYIYFANLYFKTRKGDKALQYMNKAKALYPNGAFAYIVEEFFFAYGNTLF